MISVKMGKDLKLRLSQEELKMCYGLNLCVAKRRKTIHIVVPITMNRDAIQEATNVC